MTNRELIQNKFERVIQLKGKLHNSDYHAIKFAEGELTETEYAPIRAERKAWRAEINTLEAEILELKTDI